MIGAAWPTGGTPPIAKPVAARTNAASALSTGSPSNALSAASLTRPVPLAITSTGRSVCRVLKTSDLAICATVQPIASAASFAVRVVVGISTIRPVKPRDAKASCTF